MRKTNLKKTVENRNGFTLLEILLVLGIVAIIATFSTFVSLGLYNSHSLSTERDLLVGLLERARGQAINNINQSRHGVHITAFSYTLFQGDDWQHRSANLDVVFPASGAIALSGLSDEVFDQLSGDSNTVGRIYLAGSNHQLAITINSVGQINW